MRASRNGDGAGSPGKLAVERLDGVRKLHPPLLVGGASKLVRLLRAEMAVTTGHGLLSGVALRRVKVPGCAPSAMGRCRHRRHAAS